MKAISQSPLLFIEGDKLLCYHRGFLSLKDSTDWNTIWKVSLPLGWKEKYLSSIPLFRRLLRLGIRNAHQIDKDTILLFTNKRFYEFNISTKHIIPGYIPEKGVRALNITSIKGIEGFDEMIVFGSYSSNMSKKPVHIYRRESVDKWVPYFTFDMGEINHIHNIIPDRDNSCVWIQTGDFDNAAAIWKVTDNFKTVIPIMRGCQIARGCVAYPTEQGLLYATDTPLSDNSIRILNYGTGESKNLCDISGSCIYSCKVDDNYIFSTAVEPSGLEESWKGLLSMKKGPGIKDNYCHLYCGNLTVGFREIYKVKKDNLPYALFQFGTLQFPMGTNKTNKLIVYHVSTVKHEGKYIVMTDI